MLHRISAGWARIEMTLAGLLAVGITLLVLLNVVTRAFDNAIYWVDEAAIYAMAWMTFFAASAAVHYGQSVAVTLLSDALKGRAAAWMQRAIDAVLLVFALLMVWLCWRWFMPLQLIEAGFDAQAFQSATFNFIYAEPTSTIGIRKVWIWLIMPIFSAGLLLHALANLLRRAGTEAAA